MQCAEGLGMRAAVDTLQSISELLVERLDDLAKAF
jgi:hypothetical protein